MKLLKKSTSWIGSPILGWLAACLFLIPVMGLSEGSVNFINYPGNRLFLWPEELHQLKVYADEGEFINVGASHVGITGGTIKIYRPDGTLHTTFDDSGATAGLGIINNDVEEKGGPSGGGTTAGTGYIPGVVQVLPGEEGVWTVMMEFPTYHGGNFTNMLNSATWTRAADQPLIQRVILAWDISITLNAEGNEGGILKKGRVFANKYASMVSQNGSTTSPKFYITTKQGYLYLVDCKEIDPWGFPLFSNSNGIIDGTGQPVYSSFDRSGVTVDNDPTNWDPNGKYIYNPESEDKFGFINNKIFFNIPDPTLPAEALVTDIFSNSTYMTWLHSEASTGEPLIEDFHFYGKTTVAEETCEENTMQPADGGFIVFNNSLDGTMKASLDLNNDGDYTDAVDRVLFKSVSGGVDSIFWDGLDGIGNPIPETFFYEFNFKLQLRGGEIHLMMADVENNVGGIVFTRLNGINAPNNEFYYDHSLFDATVVSGSGAPGNANSTVDPYLYSDGWGNEKMLDYWAYVDYETEAGGSFLISVTDDCSLIAIQDADGDGVADISDIDDDNDGILDRLEYCNSLSGGFDCLPNGLDPSNDEDNDRIPNYLDANDAAVGNICDDLDGDGACDQIMAVYDKDGDNIPDHFDLDSDNDGISDLEEAGHLQADLDGNGIIDGASEAFGNNGFFNMLGDNDNDGTANPIYERWDVDNDGVPDHDDLDSDNDGIHDVVEAGFGFSDTNLDGRIDDGNGNVPVTGVRGLVPLIDPLVTLHKMLLPIDHDNDFIPDWHDLDSDNDGIHDVVEGGNVDTDNDAILGFGVPVVDGNGLVVSDASGAVLTTTSRPMDLDNDLIPDWHDLDSDNDGIYDVREAGWVDLDGDAVIGVGLPIVNEHGIVTHDEQGSPMEATSLLFDKDNDLVPDWHDLDSDNDGINDVKEADLKDDDNDGIIGTSIPNVDSNGIPVSSSNGDVLITTAVVLDWDNDGIPDWHDLDSDNDGLNDVEEAGLVDLDNDGIIGSGLPNVNDFGQSMEPELLPISNIPDTDDDNIPDWHDLDSDNDGILDVLEAEFSDPDNDGLVGEGTLPVNDDGQVLENGELRAISNPRDLDDDGFPDYKDTDRDGDGIDDAYECATGYGCVDTDNDGTPDVDDLDSDNDDISDADECSGSNPCPDSDGNGIPDFLEFTCSVLSTPRIDAISGGEAFCTGTDLSLSAMNAVLDMLGSTSVNYVWSGPNGFEYNGTTPSINGPFELVIPNVDLSNKGAYALQVTSNTGCESDPTSIFIDVMQSPETPSITALIDVLCVDENFELNSSIYSGNGVNYEWYLKTDTEEVKVGETSIPTFFIDEVTSMNEGIYTVKVNVDDCQSLESNAIDVAVIDVTNLDAQDDSYEVDFGNNIDLESLVENDELGFDDPNSWGINIVDAPMFGTIVFEDGVNTYIPSTNFVGEDQFIYEICSTVCPDVCDRAEARIRINNKKDENVNCGIPNIFSPNNDGFNDSFVVPCALWDVNNVFMVFNRWGDKVYYKKSYKNDWQGTFNGNDLPAGTYFYIYKNDVNLDNAQQGYISLIRE